jgi:hypothetical protein
MIVVAIVVPILLIVPATLVFVPPLMVFAPALFASFVQLVSGMLGFRTGLAMMLDRLVQFVIGLLGAVPAGFFFVVSVRAWHSGVTQQRQSYRQGCQQSCHSHGITSCGLIHANSP